MLNVEAPELPLLGDMFKMMADDPVGVAIADDLMFRLFSLHVIGVRVPVSDGRSLGIPSGAGDRLNLVAIGFAA